MIGLAAKIPGWFRNAALGTLAFAAGFVTNYYVDYRNTYVAALNSNYEHFDKASQDIRNTLRVFADVSRGNKLKSDEYVADLQMKLLEAVGKVEDLSRRVDGGSQFVRSYQDAAVNLRNAAEMLEGPLNGKVMVDAVNDFLLAENRVRDTVLQEYNSFLW